ncbi:hypothetical protein FHQ08_08265 [Lactobacillus sp. CC-MHH1034]|uniref:hypothetical protein n=1 Tax=Agrilactobacillus fermenti TaxID=2586909 RepID=UPI001E291699|nr:hypothetical protein [Agrilactobacillus fermenti]MCD2256715.1 hypothetical protein [Agrilactobacillus fermenti]
MNLNLGTYEYVQRVYNENMLLKAYKLPLHLSDGRQTPIQDGLITLSLEIMAQHVIKITIVTTNPRSSIYMQVFEGFEFGFDAVATWIQNYEISIKTHGPSRGVVKGILADYNTDANDRLTVSLTRIAVA